MGGPRDGRAGQSVRVQRRESIRGEFIEEAEGAAEKRTRWDEVFGHVAMLFKRSRAWEPLGFASFGIIARSG